VHKEGDGEGPSGDAGLQPVLPPGELPDEVLPLPHPLLASASLRRRRLQRSHRRLRPRQDGGRDHRLPRPHHLPRRPPHPPQTWSRHQTHDRRSERHGTGPLLMYFNFVRFLVLKIWLIYLGITKIIIKEIVLTDVGFLNAGVWCRVCVPARAQEQPCGLQFVHRDLGVQDSWCGG